MIAFMVFVTGAAISLAVYYLGLGLTGFMPGFDRQTVERVGLPGAFALYFGAGPVLLFRAMEHAPVDSTATTMRNILALTFLILLWTGALGVVAVESARSLL